MKKFSLFILALITLSQVLFSCRPKAHLPQLIETDSVCETRVDSAIIVLQHLAKYKADLSDLDDKSIEKHKYVMDSIDNLTVSEAISRINSIYYNQVREKENLRLQNEYQKKQAIIIILSIIAIFYLVIVYYTIVYTREKRKALKFKKDKYEMLLKEEENMPEKEKLIRCEQIKNSNIYVQIKHILNDPHRSLKMTEAKWSELSHEINTIYPNFDTRLRELCRMSLQDYHVCLLIKIGITPTDIAFLTYKSKPGIGSIRRKLYERAFRKKGEAKNWDEVILSL